MDDSLGGATPRGTAVLVVDVQEAAVARGPYRGDVVLDNITRLIRASRANGVEVIYVQHDGAPGDPDEPGSEGWEIYAGIRPDERETVVHKSFNSAFRGTDLRAYLEARDIGTLIVVGIQTEYCVDTTVRVAFEYGFEVVVPEMTNSTFDNGELTASQIHELHNRRIFDGRFAAVRSMDDTLRAIANGGVFPR